MHILYIHTHHAFLMAQEFLLKCAEFLKICNNSQEFLENCCIVQGLYCKPPLGGGGLNRAAAEYSFLFAPCSRKQKGS